MRAPFTRSGEGVSEREAGATRAFFETVATQATLIHKSTVHT